MKLINQKNDKYIWRFGYIVGVMSLVIGAHITVSVIITNTKSKINLMTKKDLIIFYLPFNSNNIG